jgi:hypothetical protein
MSEDVVCAVCGKVHARTNIELCYKLPDAVHAIVESERKRRCRFSADAGVLDEKRFFLRGTLPLPVSGRPRPYNIGIWAEVSREAFVRTYELWADPDQAAEPRFPGVLANTLPQQPETCGLAVLVQLEGPTTRPTFHLSAADHPLFQEHTTGIDEHRALEYTDYSTPQVTRD